MDTLLKSITDHDYITSTRTVVMTLENSGGEIIKAKDNSTDLKTLIVDGYYALQHLNVSLRGTAEIP